MDEPLRNNTMTIDGSYTVVIHKLTIGNSLYFTHLVPIVLRPSLDVSYTAKKSLKRPENRVFDRFRKGGALL